MTKFVVVDGRKKKAKKIESVVCDYHNIDMLEGKNILDIGCGTGEIISYFNKNKNNVFAVDVFNQVDTNMDVGKFIQVDTAKLPFEDGFFDIIFSNHVVEHIAEQDVHMSEIYRCLKTDGICYYATPNWNYPIEPHHRLPLLHYLGNHLFHKMLKLLNRYEEDLYLLSYGNMKSSFIKHNFLHTEYTVNILKHPEKFNLDINLTRYIPSFVLRLMSFLIPTNIFVLAKK